MEIFYISVVTIIPTLLFIFYISKHIRPITRSVGSLAPLPPGKMGLPILGESVSFVSTLLSSTPEKFVRDRIKRYASSTFKTSLFGQPTIVMYGQAGSKKAFANEGKLVRGWWPEALRTLFPTKTDMYTIAKDFRAEDLSQFIEPGGLRKYVGIMDSVARKHLQAKWHGQNEVTVFPRVAEYTFSLACRLYLSTDDAEFIEKLKGPMNTFTSGLFSIPINLPWTKFGRAVRISKVIVAQFLTAVKKRRQELSLDINKDVTAASNEDILSHLLLRPDENGNYMTDTDVALRVMGIIVASNLNSTIVLSVLLKYLGDYPEIYHKVFQEQMEVARNKEDGELLNRDDIMKMKYSWNAALEAMRLYPPVTSIFREVISDFTYSDYHVPKDWKLHINIHTMHRDPQYFPNPEKFDPSRFENGGPMPYTFMPFGGGPLICPGRNYARMEILVFLHNLVKKFKWENILPDEKIILNPTPRPAKGLPIRLHPH